MTWIVGMPTFWGYSIGISDIRVTLADGSEVDCLQTIYPIAQSMALGFAGSVAIGFTMVRAMQQWLHCDEPGRAWYPLEVAELWPPIAPLEPGQALKAALESISRIPRDRR